MIQQRPLMLLALLLMAAILLPARPSSGLVGAATAPTTDDNPVIADESGKTINNAKDDHGDKGGITVGGFKLSKLFDFSEYKRIYGKKYTNALQELARMKLYLGGVLRVLVAAIKHRFLGKRYYLAVNRMTDWTDDEWHQVSVPASVFRGESRPAAAESAEEKKAKQFEAAELSDIDYKLPELFKGNEETFKRFVEEIGGGDNDADADADTATSGDTTNKLNAQMLFRQPGAGAIYPVPKSNNPAYEQPQVMSQSDASEQTERPLDESDAEKINESPNILDGILDGITFLFNAAEQVASNSEEKKVEVFSEGPDEIFIDHRQSGCLRPPSHQLECGSCYAFASMALYEYLYCMQQQPPEKREPVQFSVQYLIDCGSKRNPHLHGCKGGNPLMVAEFVNKYGIDLEAHYPYAGEPQMCPYADDEDPSVMGYLRVEEPGLHQVKPVDFDEVLKKQPVLINIYPNKELKSYGGEIYDNYNCEYEYAHAMMLVGSGRKDNLEYWIIRNSLGSEWGNQGYLYMSKGAALNCLVDDGTTSYAKFPAATALNPKYTKKDMAKLLPLLGTQNSESELKN